MEDEGITRCFLTRDHLAQDYLVIALAAIFCLRSRFLAASTRCSPSRVQACYPRCLRCRRRLSCSACVALALMVGTLIFVYLMLRSRRGLALGAIRDHETAAAGLGVDIYSTMLAVYVATAGRNRYGRRTHSSAEGPHLPGRCLLGTRLDSLCDFHCRHRWYRNDGGSDRRYGHLLSDAAISRRLRRLVSPAFLGRSGFWSCCLLRGAPGA